jgi:hypothetical protein
MHAHIGDGVEPVLGSGSQHAEVGDIEPRQEVFLDVAHAVFHPALFVALADIARHDAKAMMLGEGSILGIEHRRLAQGAFEDGGFEVVDHDGLGHPAERLKGVLMTGEEVFHGLRDGELHIHQAAIAQHHDKETQATAGLPHRYRAERAPLCRHPDYAELQVQQFENKGLLR